MSRRMSVSLTLAAVEARQKTVTRRHVDTWKHLKAGDRLTCRRIEWRYLDEVPA